MSTDHAAGKDALHELQPLIGEWSMGATFPSSPTPPAPKGPAESGEEQAARGGARTVFEWILDGQFVLQRAEVPQAPSAPDLFAIIGYDASSDAYTQHYFDSRGIARVYARTFGDGLWGLSRESADFSPLPFSQRFTGTFSDDGRSIEGRWESSSDGSSWERDFDLTYTKVT